MTIWLAYGMFLQRQPLFMLLGTLDVSWRLPDTVSHMSILHALAERSQNRFYFPFFA